MMGSIMIGKTGMNELLTLLGLTLLGLSSHIRRPSVLGSP
jgi:hypothetical protein